MIATFIILCLAGTTFGSIISWSPGLKARFGGSGFGSTSFMNIPKTSAEAEELGWTTVTPPTSPTGLETLAMWCPTNEFTLCVYTDDNGYVAGTQIALDMDFLTDTVYDMEQLGFSIWQTTLGNGTSKSYYAIQQYYVSASYLATDAKTRNEGRDSTTMLQENAVWVKGFKGELYKITGDITELSSDVSIYKGQACFPFMGSHYYYNMTTETECSADTIFPWFVLVQSNQLIGLGFNTFGKITIPSGATNWFESPTSTAVRIIVPKGPECYYELADTPGVITMHTYFIETPYYVNCLVQ